MMLRKATACLLCAMLLWTCASAELTDEETDGFYAEMEQLVDGIGNRNVTAEGQALAQEYLWDALKAEGFSEQEGTLALCPASGVKSTGEEFNVNSLVGVLPAEHSDPRIIVLCAHYDSNGPGARDNASGVAGVLTLLRRFVRQGAYPDAELRFVLFSAEETGHQGSKAYVESLTEDERERMLAVFNLDMVVVDLWEEDFAFSVDTMGARTESGYEEGSAVAAADNRVSRAVKAAIAQLDAFASEDDGVMYCVPRHMGRSDHDAFHFAGIDSASISFRGNVTTDGKWSALMHQEEDRIGDFDWDRTWKLLEIVYTAMDGLANDAEYGG